MRAPKAAWVLCCLATAAMASKEKSVDLLALPLVSFSSDIGVGFGIAGGAQIYAPGYEPYQHSVGGQIFLTTRGVQRHFIRYDGPDLIWGLRVEARLEFRRDRLMPYFGAGNKTAPLFQGNTSDRVFNYDVIAPGGWVRARGHLLGPDNPLQLWGGYSYRHLGVNPFDPSLLLIQQPQGTQGGDAGQVNVGVVRDTRDDEANPMEGGVDEIALRLAGRITASDYEYAGVTVSERRFIPLGPAGLVLALRGVLDHQWGDVPFFEWPTVGGLTVVEAVGGANSVRGVPRARFAGNTKLFVNIEPRWMFNVFSLRGAMVKLGGVAFLDAGRVWQPQIEDGPWYAWHPGVGLGVRAVRRAAVLRADWAYSPETGRNAYYLTVGHTF